METPAPQTAPKLATPQQAIATKKETTPKDFPGMLKAFLPEIQRALPKHLNGDRISRIALTAFRRNPKLAECNPLSVFAAVIQASQLGLEIDTQGRAFLVPYKKECQFIPGWKGLTELLNRSGQGTAWTGAVFQGDDFDYMLGDSPFVHHKPSGESDPDLMTHVYAVGRVKGAEWPIIEVWKIERVTRHRNKYNKVGDKHYSFNNWEMYARKIVLLQVLKYMPASVELATAIELDDAAARGEQGLSVKDAIEGSWSPVPEEPEEKPKETATATATVAQVSDRPVSDGAPGFEDAVAAVRNGDIDLARSIAATLDDGQKQQIEVAIQNRDKLKETVDKPAAKGKGKKLFKEE
jgi:recombination protein RecT